MIPFDFDYYRPSSIAEAADVIRILHDQEKKYMFYSGGTEFITFARTNQIIAEAVIDIKGIPECNRIEIQGGQFVIGAAVSLNQISKSGLFPLLGETVKGIADHTSRNKITIGGNLGSQLAYREGVLPLLLSDARVKLDGGKGEMILPLNEVFEREMKLPRDQFLVQLLVEKEFLDQPFVTIKKTRMTKIGYPLVSVAALVKDDMVRAAFSGVCAYPFRSKEVEAFINDSSIPVEDRISQITAHLPSPIVGDSLATAEYREFVLKNILRETIEVLELT